MAQRILRPMEYGDLLDETFDLYKRHFLLFIGIAGVIFLPMSTILYSFGAIAQTILGILMLPLHYIVVAAATWAVSQSYLGKEVSILGSYQAVSRRLVLFLLTMLVATIIIGCGFMLLIIPGVIFMFWYAFISEVFVVEGKSGTAARNRSKELASGHYGRIFVLGFITSLINYFIQMLFGLPLGIILGFSQAEVVMMSGGPIGGLVGLVQGLASTLVMPIQVIAFVLLYYDVRVRKEGFDIQLLAESLGEAPAEQDVPQEEARPL